MPDQGRLTEDLLAHAVPAIAPLYPPPPWKLPGARILKVIFETDSDPVLDWLPPKLTRSSPPYAVITFEQYPRSPVGPFSVAHQFIGCRAGHFVRVFALQSVVDNPRALVALREGWGFPCVAGTVSLRRGRGRATATAGAAGSGVCEVSVTGLEAIEPDLVRFDPLLTLRLSPSLRGDVRHDLVQLAQIDPETEIRKAARGKGTVTYGDRPGGNTWTTMPCRNVVSAVLCEVDSELPFARYVIPY